MRISRLSVDCSDKDNGVDGDCDVLVILIHQVSAVFITVIWCNCAKYAIYLPLLFYANKPQRAITCA